MNKSTIILTITIITLIIIIIGLIFYFKIIPEVSNNSYLKGYNKGKIDLMLEQTNTKTLFYISNNTIQSNTLNEICGAQQ